MVEEFFRKQAECLISDVDDYYQYEKRVDKEIDQVKEEMKEWSKRRRFKRRIKGRIKFIGKMELPPL